ncbi:histone-lysine N-methyltransferase, putative [Hepatocystis sp. ex Piliocolobus tephrosceles]|nr:histone-lysine N-methyltransferase, putative [Hepatocystis sp. ex Piliocolobus tephrosceles]
MTIIKRTFHNYFANNIVRNFLKKNKISLNDIQNKIYVGKSAYSGLGIFALEDIPKNELIEICPTIKINNKDVPEKLIDYLFENKKENKNEQIVELMTEKKENLNYKYFPLGYGILYNHSDNANALVHFVSAQTKDDVTTESIISNEVMLFCAQTNIKKNEEICISYGQTWWENRDWKPINKEIMLRKMFYPSEKK